MIQLNVGCGAYPAPRPWWNVDLIDRRAERGEGADFLADARRLPLRDGSVGMVSAMHFLEHIPIELVVPVLAECRRVLEPAGRLLVTGPDCARGAQLYLKGRISQERLLADLTDDLAERDPGAHEWSCTWEACWFALHLAGFEEIENLGGPFNVGPEWWIFDRVTPDQVALVARKGA